MARGFDNAIYTSKSTATRFIAWLLTIALIGASCALVGALFGSIGTAILNDNGWSVLSMNKVMYSSMVGGVTIFGGMGALGTAIAMMIGYDPEKLLENAPMVAGGLAIFAASLAIPLALLGMAMLKIHGGVNLGYTAAATAIGQALGLPILAIVAAVAFFALVTMGAIEPPSSRSSSRIRAYADVDLPPFSHSTTPIPRSLIATQDRPRVITEKAPNLKVEAVTAVSTNTTERIVKNAVV